MVQCVYHIGLVKQMGDDELEWRTSISIVLLHDAHVFERFVCICLCSILEVSANCALAFRVFRGPYDRWRSDGIRRRFVQLFILVCIGCVLCHDEIVIAHLHFDLWHHIRGREVFSFDYRNYSLDLLRCVSLILR